MNDDIQLIHFITNEFSSNPEDTQEPLEEVLIVPSQIQSIQPESSPTLDTAGELSADADAILDVLDGHSTDE